MGTLFLLSCIMVCRLCSTARRQSLKSADPSCISYGRTVRCGSRSDQQRQTLETPAGTGGRDPEQIRPRRAVICMYDLIKLFPSVIQSVVLYDTTYSPRCGVLLYQKLATSVAVPLNRRDCLEDGRRSTDVKLQFSLSLAAVVPKMCLYRGLCLAPQR